MDCLCRCDLFNLNTRIDQRLIRLEILQYYSDPKNCTALDPEQKRLLKHLREDYDYERSGGRKYPDDPWYEKPDKPKKPEEQISFPMGQENGLWYAEIAGKKIFLGESKDHEERYMKGLIKETETDSPHRYLDPAQDGVDVPEGAILVDVGAAEGYFGMKYLDRCKEVYFFESEERWLRCLRKTCAPYMDKIEIVEGYVGDQNDQIKLDDFFRDKEKPTFIKMDVEGAEGAVLRGMSGMLHDPSLPMTLLICTYHRQEDWDRYEAMLKGNFKLYSGDRYYWHLPDACPPFFRKGVMRAVKK